LKSSLQTIKNKIFKTDSIKSFNKLALEIFFYQYKYNSLYQKFVEQLSIDTKSITHFEQIPFLPVEFFKTHKILSGKSDYEITFLSSGTSNNQRSCHYISDLNIYEKSFTSDFNYFYGNVEDYVILALLPNYLEQKNSSLVYMVSNLIKNSKHKESGFYLKDINALAEQLKDLEKYNRKVLLLGVSYALLDLAENFEFEIPNTIIMETGGMKGRREELTREKLHEILKKSFGVKNIHSEYGMTELLSQAYSKGEGKFYCPPWMKILIRDINDPFSLVKNKKTGGINIIDFANINSCSFIATQDLGRINDDDSFEVIGRFDESDIRGCSLMIE